MAKAHEEIGEPVFIVSGVLNYRLGQKDLEDVLPVLEGLFGEFAYEGFHCKVIGDVVGLVYGVLCVYVRLLWFRW